jgi:TPR repeat protein
MRGEGTEADADEAVAWFVRSAEQGLAASQLALGDLYATDQPGARDPVASRRWYERAAAQGNEAARARLAEIFEHNPA